MGDLLASRLAAIGLPRMIEGLAVDILRRRRQMTADRSRELVVGRIGHDIRRQIAVPREE